MRKRSGKLPSTPFLTLEWSEGAHGMVVHVYSKYSWSKSVQYETQVPKSLYFPPGKKVIIGVEGYKSELNHFVFFHIALKSPLSVTDALEGIKSTWSPRQVHPGESESDYGQAHYYARP